MAQLLCYSCQAPRLPGARVCLGCGAEQTAHAQEIHGITTEYARRLQNTRQGLLMVVLVAGALGTGFGVWLDGQSGGMATRNIAVQAANSMTREQIEDTFIRSLNETLVSRQIAMNIVGSLRAADGTLVLELGQPTVWSVMDEETRVGMMAFIGVAYTKALAVGGAAVDLSLAHPVVSLAYHGCEMLLASRLSDGKVRVFPPQCHAGEGPAAPVATGGATSVPAKQP
jgi:hypothetical protein